MSRVLFICKRRNNSYGISYGLINSARFVAKALKQNGISSKVVDVIDNNSIDREVHKYRPTHVIIEALWVVPRKFHELLCKYPRIKWTVRVHSKASFIANEGIAFDWILLYKEIERQYNNFKVSANNTQFTKELIHILKFECLYLPNIYSASPLCGLHYEYQKRKDVNIGCFGSIRPMKNHLQQAIAAIMYADRERKILKFHINSDRTEQKGDQPLKNLRALFSGTRHFLIEHPWLNHRNFLKLVVKMDLGMQVSLSESFNIVTGDFVNNNIPIITTNELHWMNPLYYANPTSSESIINALSRAQSLSRFNLQYLNKIGLRMHNKKAIGIWLTRLGNN